MTSPSPVRGDLLTPTIPIASPELCGPPLDRERQRTDRRFVVLMYAQWIAAIGIATWLTPRTSLGHRLPDGTLLLLAFVCGGVATLASMLAERLWNGRRPARIIIGICQMLMSALFLHLTQGRVEMHFHIYGSLALLALYADWTVLAAASLIVIGDQLVLDIVEPGSLLSVLTSSNWEILGESVKLLLCNAFFLWSGRERKRESKHVGDQQRRQRDLLHRAFHDSSTGLPNRAALEAEIDTMLERGDALSCLSLEVEGLAEANDLLGLTGGEVLLRSVVARIQDCTHHDDRFGRLGGEKFIVLVHRLHSKAQLSALAESIVRSMAEPHTINGRALTTGVSIGIACAPVDAHDRESLLAAGDRSMLAVRCDGRNHYRFASDLRQPVDDRHSLLSSKLQRALLEGGLQLVYQPIFTINEQMAAVEALTRWRDAEEGPISPGEFIPVAEATGLIVPLSNWVLRTACQQMATWVTLGTTLERIAVNISVKQVWRSDFVSTVEQTLLETGLKPSRLELEVTESALATDFEAVKKNLLALRKLGVRISIDDFGTGYSSLSRVRELDADTLKVDRTFVQSASETANGAAVVQAIVDMAHTLKLSVVAEGVETIQQLQMLRSMRCDEVQGFLLARPQSPEILTAALRNAAANPKPDRRLRLVPRIA